MFLQNSHSDEALGTKIFRWGWVMRNDGRPVIENYFPLDKSCDLELHLAHSVICLYGFGLSIHCCV